MNDFFKNLKNIFKNSDLVIGAGIFIFILIMIVPVHPFLLDLSLSFVIASSLLILLMSLYVKRPLDFSTFPSVLLFITLLRLALNVASTRNILLDGGGSGTGAAGNIVKAFGEFVVGGNYIVGIIIFVILVVINFVVITKGSGRVAEVAARFTLDAMPGKQMAIDADLNSGLINEKEAKRRREEVAQEADFYGSMDGASKFVRGDAIAGILITLINLVGGVIVGIIQGGLSIQEATETFTLLTVGDGLVGQIPALIISTAAGVVVTRNGGDNTLGDQLALQFKIHPKALYIVSFVLLSFVFIPSFPKIPFLILSFCFVFTAYYLERKNLLEEEKKKAFSLSQSTKKSDNLENLLSMELLELEIGYGLINLVDAEQNGDLLERITQIRKQFALDWGVIIPSVRIRDNLELRPGGYSIKFKGVQVGHGELMADYLLAMDPGTVLEEVEGIKTKEPVFGLSAVWITSKQREDANYYGYTVVDSSTIIATHVTEVIKQNLHEIFGREELAKSLQTFKEENPKIVTDLIPDILSFGTVLKVMQNLLREGISIRDMRTILESLSENGEKVKEANLLTEFTRASLYRTITESLKNEKGEIPVYILDHTLEESLSKNLNVNDPNPKIHVSNDTLQAILANLHEKIDEAADIGERMIVMCSPFLRPYFRKLVERFIPSIVVIGHNEISNGVSLKNLGKVRVS